MTKLPERLLNSRYRKEMWKWAVDLTIAPDNKYGRSVLKDSDKWVKEKYGLGKSMTIKIK